MVNAASIIRDWLQTGFIIVFLTLSLAGHSVMQAKEAQPVAQDPALEAEMMRIASAMRCLECQNETLAASHAGLAMDLREQIRHMLTDGRSEQEIVEFMVARYGDFVLYRPPFKPLTWTLWIGPFILMIFGFFAMRMAVRAQRRLRPPKHPMSAQQEQEAQRLLAAARKEVL